MIIIEKALYSDLVNILRLQKISYLAEEALLRNFALTPLKQGLRELEAEFNRGVILKAFTAAAPDDVIGSVRGHFDENKLYVGRLIVHPAWQRQGLGTRLFQALQAYFPQAGYETLSSSFRHAALKAKSGYLELAYGGAGH